MPKGDLVNLRQQSNNDKGVDDWKEQEARVLHHCHRWPKIFKVHIRAPDPITSSHQMV